MMKSFLTISASLLVVPAVLAQSITLDPAEMEAAKQRIFGGGVVNTPQETTTLPPADEHVQLWQSAMASAGTDMMPVLLLALLSELNPQAPLATHAELYAEALRLHRLAAAGNAAACETLALSLETGVLPGELRFFVSSICAEAVRNRAARFEISP